MNAPVRSLKIAFIITLLTLSLFTICFAASLQAPQVMAPSQVAVDTQFEYVLAMVEKFPVYGEPAAEKVFFDKENPQTAVLEENSHLNYIAIRGQGEALSKIEALDGHGNVKETYQVRTAEMPARVLLTRNDGCSIAITLDNGQRRVRDIEVKAAKGAPAKELHARAEELAAFLGYQPSGK